MQQLGCVPRRLIWDNESGIGRGKRHAEGVGAFTGTLATSLQRLKPYDPESKGVVERRNGFFETSFMPGRDFASPGDFNTQFVEWLAGEPLTGRQEAYVREHEADDARTRLRHLYPEH